MCQEADLQEEQDVGTRTKWVDWVCNQDVEKEAVAGILLQDGVVDTISTGQDEDQEATKEKVQEMISGTQAVIGVKAMSRIFLQDGLVGMSSSAQTLRWGRTLW